MFERWRSFTLSKENFKETVEAIGDTLKALGVSENEAKTGKELVEHIFSLQLSVRPEVFMSAVHFHDLVIFKLEAHFCFSILRLCDKTGYTTKTRRFIGI